MSVLSIAGSPSAPSRSAVLLDAVAARFALRDVPAGRLAVVRAQGQDGADELQLKPGSDVVALVKSTEVSIAKL